MELNSSPTSGGRLVLATGSSPRSPGIEAELRELCVQLNTAIEQLSDENLLSVLRHARTTLDQQLDHLSSEDRSSESEEPTARQLHDALEDAEEDDASECGSYDDEAPPARGPAERGEDEGQEEDEPNYETTGKLAEAANTVNGVNMKYGEPPDMATPTKHWRLYVFKGKEALDPYHIHRQSMYLLGRERRVCDIPLDHPSCSSQHCVLQFRMTQKTETNERGEQRQSRLVRPYLIDLNSTNGCYINGERIEAQKYVELLEKDCLRFGYSSREYVLLNADNQ